MKREELYKIRNLIEKASESLTDEEAIEAPELFAEWAIDKQYAVNTRVRYDSKLYKCIQAHTSQADWTPDATPALWVEVAEPGEIPVWKQPTGEHDAYNTGDKVWYPEKDTDVYESLIDNNVWSPEAYPAGWQKK